MVVEQTLLFQPIGFGQGCHCLPGKWLLRIWRNWTGRCPRILADQILTWCLCFCLLKCTGDSCNAKCLQHHFCAKSLLSFHHTTGAPSSLTWPCVSWLCECYWCVKCLDFGCWLGSGWCTRLLTGQHDDIWIPTFFLLKHEGKLACQSMNWTTT